MSRQVEQADEDGPSIPGPTFRAVVRGYKAEEPDPDLAAVIVEVDPDVEVPKAACLRELGHARRRSDRLRVERAVACIMGRWEALEIGTRWVDQWVYIGVGTDGRAVLEQVSPDIPF